MSNVLIGIVSVIIFIGLSLAGAIFFGDQVKKLTNDSRATAVIQVASQMANAINLHNVQEGESYPTPLIYNTQMLVDNNYLKILPVSPVKGGSVMFTIAEMGLSAEFGTVNSVAKPAILVLAPLGVDNFEICEAAARQSNGTVVEVTDAASLQLATIHGTGCFNVTTTFGGTPAGVYIFALI